jgi:hypothetical protein
LQEHHRRDADHPIRPSPSQYPYLLPPAAMPAESPSLYGTHGTCQDVPIRFLNGNSGLRENASGGRGQIRNPGIRSYRIDCRGFLIPFLPGRTMHVFAPGMA